MNDSFNDQLSLEHHGARTPADVCTRIAQRAATFSSTPPSGWHCGRWSSARPPHHPPSDQAISGDHS